MLHSLIVSPAHRVCTVNFGMCPLKRDFTSAPMVSTTGVPGSMPTSVPSSAEQLAALGQATAVVVEDELQRGLAGRQPGRAGDRRALPLRRLLTGARSATTN